MQRTSRGEFNSRNRQLIAYLRDEIKKGILKKGDYLPSEVELGKKFGISKESVRRALEVLVEEEWIVKIPRVGNRVTISIEPELGERTEEAAFTELRLAYYPSLHEEGRLKRAAASFELANPGIRVKLMPTPFPLDYAEHGIADVITISAWDALKLKERDSSLSLLAEAPVTMYANPLLSAPFRTTEGRLAAAPFVYSPVVLCYNRAHFEACGIEPPDDSWTWYTLLKIARTLHKQLDVRGFVAHIQSVNRWPIFLLQNGFSFQAGEAQRAAEDPALWESLRISRDLVYQQGAPILWTESDSDVERWFRDGRASMILTTYYGMNRFMDTDLDYGAAPLPTLRSRDTLLLVTGMAISAKSAMQQEAQLLVQYLCSLEIQTDIRQYTTTLPVHPEALYTQAGLLGNRSRGEGAAAVQWNHARTYSDLNMSTEVLEAIREELKAYWSRVEDEAEVSERLEMLLG